MANYIVIDTETAPTVNYNDNNAHPETSLVYDLGYVICDGNGNVIVERSFVITDTFYGRKNNMESAYYACKIPTYEQGIKRGEWETVSFLTAYETFQRDCREYKVKNVWAFNVRFDETVLNNTLRVYSNNYRKFFIPYGVKTRDIWDYASNITSSTSYIKFCIDHGYFTATGNPQTNAEKVFAFLNDQADYEERHTALEDCKIENAILKAAKAKHTKTRTKSKGQGWRDAAKAYKAMQA